VVFEEGHRKTRTSALIEGLRGGVSRASGKNKETSGNASTGCTSSTRPSTKGSAGGAGADTGSQSQFIVVD
jgi:hypothetical protein